MSSETEVNGGRELTASTRFLLATAEAAGLIMRSTPPRWHFMVRKYRRAYGSRDVSFDVVRHGPVKPKEMQPQLRRLIVRDFVRSPPETLPRRFTVLELSALRRGDLAIRLNTGGLEHKSDVFSPLGIPDCVRFWIDVHHELGQDLLSHLTTDEYSRLRGLGDAAAAEAAVLVRERREARSMSQSEFAEHTGISVDDVARTENWEAGFTDAMLKMFEKTGDGEVVATEPPLIVTENTSGAELRALREARSLTQRDLAELTGLSQPFICELERGTKRVLSHTAEQITAALVRHDRDVALGRRLTPVSGPELRKLREERGLTQEELAERAGLVADSISRMETGKAKTLRRTQERILKAIAEHDEYVKLHGRWEPISGPELCALRQQRGLTQKQLAARVGLSEECISNTERGINRFKKRTQARVLAALEQSGQGHDRVVTAVERFHQSRRTTASNGPALA